jgi:hypothetical protein
MDSDAVYCPSYDWSSGVVRFHKNLSPQEMIADGTEWNGIAVVGGYAYLTVTTALFAGQIWRADIATHDFVEVASSLNDPWGLASDGTFLYWPNSDNGTISKMARTGGPISSLATGQDHPTKIVVDSHNAYWMTQFGIGQTGLDGSGGVTTPIPGTPADLALDATHVYCTDTSGGSVWRTPIGGGPVVKVAEGQDGPTAIAVDHDAVYWIEFLFDDAS